MISPRKNEPSTLLDEPNDAKAEAVTRNTAPKGGRSTVKRGDMEF